jgi:solute carrier family 35 protein E3
MTTFGFHFIYALTLIHTLATLLGMQAFAYFGMFEKKKLPKLSIASLAGAYVGYIVLNNLNLQMNTVGFYQISKIAVAPAVSARPQRNLTTSYIQPLKSTSAYNI